MKRVRTGPEVAFHVKIDDDSVLGVFCVDPCMYVAVSRCEIIRFNKTGILQRHALVSTVCCFAQNLRLLVCGRGSALSVFRVDDFSRPVIEEFETGQGELRKLAYSNSGNLLFSVGEDTRTWKISCFSKSALISACDTECADTSILCSVMYGRPVVLNDVAYDPAKWIVSLNEKNRMILVADQRGGVRLWNDTQFVLEFSVPGKVDTVQWLTKRFALIVGYGRYMYLFDCKVMKWFSCGVLDQGEYFLSFGCEPTLFLTKQGIITVLEFRVPYRLWIKTDATPTMIRRCDKERKAARIAILCKNKQIQLLSPSTRHILSTCELGDRCVDFCYDRNLIVGIHEEPETHRRNFEFLKNSYVEDRDLMLAPTTSGLEVFCVNANSGTKINVMPMSSTHVTMCTSGAMWMYACTNASGDVVLLNCDNYSELHRQKIRNKKACGLWYHHKSSSLLIGFSDEVIRFDLRRNAVTGQVSTLSYDVAGLCDDTLIIGCHNGFIQTIHIGLNMVDVSNRSAVFHSDCITGLSFARAFFVSSSRDKSLRYWDYHMHLLGEVIFPFPLLTCALLNGKRNALVAIDNAVLFVPAKLIFGEHVDIYDSHTDNFDMLADPLDCVTADTEIPDLIEQSMAIQDVSNDDEIVVPPIEMDRIHIRPKTKKKRRKPLVSTRRMSQTPNIQPVASPADTTSTNPRRKTANPQHRNAPKPLISARAKPVAAPIKYPVKREPLTDRPCVRAHMYNFNSDKLFEQDNPAPAVRFKWDDPKSARRASNGASRRMAVRSIPKHV